MNGTQQVGIEYYTVSNVPAAGLPERSPNTIMQPTMDRRSGNGDGAMERKGTTVACLAMCFASETAKPRGLRGPDHRTWRPNYASPPARLGKRVATLSAYHTSSHIITHYHNALPRQHSAYSNRSTALPRSAPWVACLAGRWLAQ